MFKFKRTIKDDKAIKDLKPFKSKDISTLQINEKIFHPITLTKMDTHGFINPLCLTKLHISDNKLNYFSNYVCKNDDKYKEYIQIPPIGFSPADLLQFYSINSIDNLNYWIESNIEEYLITTLKRVLNCWIIVNIETIKLYNNFLEKICKQLLNKYINYEFKKEIEKKNIDMDKEIKYYIDYWINNYDINNIDSDLLEDLKKYIYKKTYK